MELEDEGQLLSESDGDSVDDCECKKEGESTEGAISTGHGDQPPFCWGRLGGLVSMCSALRKTWFVKESIMLLKLALPMFLYNVLQQTTMFIALLYVGRFNTPRELTAVALGIAFFNVTGFSVLVGLASSADTLCPQAYGYKNYKRVGVIFQRGVLILSLACMPIAALWLNTESILLLLRQQPCVVGPAGQFIRIFILSLPGLLMYTMLQKYLQAQSLVWVFVLAGLLVNVAVVVTSAIFIVAAKMGVIGAALSISLSTSLAPLFLIVYIKWRKLHLQTWGGWSFQSLTEWWQFLRLGVPGFLMLAFEWWAFEIGAIVVGTIDETQLAIHAIIIQYGTLLFMVTYSVGVAVNVRVGNELGAGNPVSAKRVSYIGLGLEVVAGLVFSAMMLVFRNDMARLFTTHQEVIQGTADAMVAALPVIFFDQIQGLLSGVIRATGMQFKAAVGNFVAYYVIGLPLGIVLALVVGLKTKGMWIGFSVACGIQSIILFVLFITINWKKQSEMAMEAAASKELAESESVSTEEDSVPDDVHNSGIELKKFSFGEEEEEDNEQEEDKEQDHPLASNGLGSSEDLVSYKDTEKLVSQDAAPRGGTRTLYSNTKCCKTKTSILISKSVFLLVGVAVLLVGAVLAGTIRHHPTDDQCSNSSLEFSSTPLFPNPTRTSNHGDATPYLAITPSPTSGVTGSHYGLRTTTHNIMITPSPS